MFQQSLAKQISVNVNKAENPKHFADQISLKVFVVRKMQKSLLRFPAYLQCLFELRIRCQG